MPLNWCPREVHSGLQGIPLEPERTRTAQQISQRALGIWTHPTLQVSLCLSILLRQKEGQDAPTHTRLLKAQRDDH